ncbi:hypothetical protein, variant 1 [Aphanomyces invadans]|uniref:Uncharacterized protein n=1 Tax=Aphanomyces invadans TaxID=157072 RepID=A0A024T8R5_9STRA|nr:hypothetical protein, variant 1 [Aphanomyces invadans]ETV90379.1 hypothetical protein, variant 1 [Aphanomyces invadans]|eukprot:XP_008880989.1 hypothetical protein, variant 1 [Aphanomyces invadans]
MHAAPSIHFVKDESFGVGGEHHHVANGDALVHNNVVSRSDISSYKCIPGVALFAGRQDGKLVMWSYTRLGCLLPQGQLFGGHSGPVMCLEFMQRHDNSQLLFSASADRTIKVWDPTRPTVDEPCIQTLAAHGGTVTVVKIAGTTLISCSVDRTIKLWQPDKGRTLLLHPWYICTQTLSSGGCWPTSVCLRSADLSSTYVADSGGGVSVYTTANSRERVDPTNEDQLKLKRQHNHFHALGVTQILAIPDQNLIVTISFDTKAQVFDAHTGAIVMTIENTRHCRFTGCDWDKHNHELFIVDEKGHLSIWSIDTEKCMRTELLESVPILAVTVFPGGHHVLVQRPNGATLYKVHRDESYVECQGHLEAVVGVVIATVGNAGESNLVSASIDNTLRCWDPYDLRVLYGFEEKEGELSTIAYSAPHHRLLTGNENGNIKQWNVDNGQFYTTRVHHNTVSCIVTASLDGHELFISADFDGVIWIWELMVGHAPMPHVKLQSKEPSRGNEIYCLAFNNGAYLNSPHAAYFAAGDSNGNIKLYSLDDQELLATLSNHEDSVTCLAFDGCFLFSGSDDCSIKIWNMLNPRHAYELGSIQAHALAVRDIIVLPSTGYIVSCAYDGKIRVWNYQVCGSYGQYAALIHELKKDEKLRCLTYWPQKNAIVCGTSDKNVLVFNIPMTLITPGCTFESLRPM